MADLEKVRYPSMTHTRHTKHKYSSSLGPSWQLRSGWTGKLGLGWQVGARLTDMLKFCVLNAYLRHLQKVN